MYTADFETTTTKEDCRVWCWAVSEIGNPDNVCIGKDIESFMLWCMKMRHEKVYFHNLKFDGEYIIYHLLKAGFKYVANKKEATTNSFTTLIADSGQFYSIDVYFYKKKSNVVKVTFLDSMKIIPFGVAKIAKAFNLPISKLEIDYNKSRPVGYELDEQEKDYVTNDVKIVAMALGQLFDQGLNKMTQAGNALYDYKCKTGKNFEYWFPKLDFDTDAKIRKSYKGAWTYCNPKHKNKDVGEGIVLDVNSLYPSVMRYKLLPYGKPIPFEGKYQKIKEYPLYVQRLRCLFELKPGKHPTIQLKNNRNFMETEYLTSSNDQLVELTLTNIDLKLFLEHYDVYEIEWLDGYMFKGQYGMFDDYIDSWIAEKNKAKSEGNAGMYTLSKLMLNSLYGRFALNPKCGKKSPYLNEDEAVRYHLEEEEIRDSLYIPMGTFITAYAREITIRAAQAVFHRFLYADTDSLHLIGLELPKNLEIDKYKLGAWDHEMTFEKARYLRSKTYIEFDSQTKTLKVTCAGLPDAGKLNVTWENFRPGMQYEGKMRMEHVNGGIILTPTLFTIK